jgi:sulfur carrier protein ThiS adenylyltransferase/adenylyltransferase/sulfurtransferase
LSGFSKNEIERYSRQILLRGIAAQQKLRETRALVIGAGGLGSAVLPLIAAAGIGKIELFDGDRVEQSNLGRQTLFRETDIGKSKARLAADFLRLLNPHIEIMAHDRKFTAADATHIASADLIFEGSDSLKVKFLLNDLAKQYKKPAFIAALGAAQGHAMLVSGGACYRCVFDEVAEDELPTCASEGILSTFPAVVGATVAHAAVEYILNPGNETRFWIFEKNHCRMVGIRKSQSCKNHADET